MFFYSFGNYSVTLSFKAERQYDTVVATSSVISIPRTVGSPDEQK